MRKKIFFVSMLLLLLLACTEKGKKWQIKSRYYIQKERVTDTIGKIDTTIIYGNITEQYHYGVDGKVTSINSSDGSNTEFVYTVDSKVATITDKEGKVKTHTEFLNKKGEPDSTFDVESGMVAATSKYKYIEHGDRTTIIHNKYEARGAGHQPVLSWIVKFTISDGNIAYKSIKNMQAPDTTYKVNPQTGRSEPVVTQYDNAEKLYFFDFDFEKYNPVHDKSNSRNLIKRKVELDNNLDTLDVYSYKYTFDDKGRVITDASFDSMHKSYDSTSYSYY